MSPELKKFAAVAEGMMLSHWEKAVVSQLDGEAARKYLTGQVKYRFACNTITFDRAKEMLECLGFPAGEIDYMLEPTE